MVGLMPQRGTVLSSVVVGLWYVYDCLVIQGYCISVEGPVSAVYLVCKAKIQCVWRGQLCQQFESKHSNICGYSFCCKSLKKTQPPLFFYIYIGEHGLPFNKLHHIKS